MLHVMAWSAAPVFKMYSHPIHVAQATHELPIGQECLKRCQEQMSGPLCWAKMEACYMTDA